MSYLSCFSREILTNHCDVLYKVDSKQATKLPEKDSNSQLPNYHRQLRVPSEFYADLKANLIENYNLAEIIQMNLILISTLYCLWLWV